MSASAAQRAKTAERRERAIQARIAGMGWPEIARQLGYKSRGAACTDVTRAMEKNLAAEAQAVEIYREIEVARLDRLQAAHWTAATTGIPERDKDGDVIMIDGRPLMTGPDPQHGDLVRKIIMDRAKVRGAIAAQKHELLTMDAIDEQIRELTAKLMGTSPD